MLRKTHLSEDMKTAAKKHNVDKQTIKKYKRIIAALVEN